MADFDFLPDNAGLTPYIDFGMLADVTLRNIFQPANAIMHIQSIADAPN